MDSVITRLAAVLGVAVLLAGCFEDVEYDDISRFMDDARKKRSEQIEPLPSFNDYVSFTYLAENLRNPFAQPPKAEKAKAKINRDIGPDKNREKQFLENYPLDSFLMVGSVSNSDGIWGLVRMEEGVYRVGVGDYIGLDYGRIIGVTEESIQLLEVISNGQDSWMERPTSIVFEQPLD